MNHFSVTRRILIEKTTLSSYQLSVFVEQQLNDCVVYKYTKNEIYFYIGQYSTTLLELAMRDENKICNCLLNKELFANINISKRTQKNSTRKRTIERVIENLLILENNFKIDCYLEKPSSYDYVTNGKDIIKC